MKQGQERNMTRFLIISLLALIYTDVAVSAPWWEQLTVCRMDTTQCYTGMGAGFDAEMWDASGNNEKGCWGMKYICAEALQQESNKPVLVAQKDLTDKNINPDFDINKLSDSGDCFGRRITNKSGNQVMVNGNYVNVYCDGVLNKSDETLANGEIVYGTQPTCDTLKKNGFVAVENGKCFGKYYDESEHYIQCGKDLKPEQIIVLNGARLSTVPSNAPKTSAEAEKIFKEMQSISKTQKTQYFKK